MGYTRSRRLCAYLVITLGLLTACATRATPTPIVTSSPILPAAADESRQASLPAHAALSLLPTPTPTPTATPPVPDAILVTTKNGDLVLYDLAAGRASVLLAGKYDYNETGCGTACFALNYPARVAPDGNWLVLATLEQGTWLVALDGSAQRLISPNPVMATWAPDSSRIVFADQAEPVTQVPPNTPRFYNVLYTYMVQGEGDSHRLAQMPGGIFYPTWSPACDTGPAAIHDRANACAQHIFALVRMEADDVQLWVVDVETGRPRGLGPYRGPAIEMSPEGFRWSPDGRAIWLRSGWPYGLVGIAFPADGSPPRPWVDICLFDCVRADSRLSTTQRGWTIDRDGRTLHVSAPNGEAQSTLTDMHFLGALDQLWRRSSEVYTAARLAPSAKPDAADTWVELSPDTTYAPLPIRISAPATWHMQSEYQKWYLSNFTLEGDAGGVMLDDTHLLLVFGFAESEWNTTAMTHADWMGQLVNIYDSEVYQVRAEPVAIGPWMGATLRSPIFPTAEQIVLRLPHGDLHVTRWPRFSAQDGVLWRMLASVQATTAP